MLKYCKGMNALFSIMIFLIVILSFNQSIHATDPDSTKTDSTVIEIDYTDGPHIFWKDDSSAIVFYLCDKAIDSQTLYGNDTIRFNGFCRDSNIQYVIPVGKRTSDPFIISGAPRVFAVSDLHGEYEYFVDLLINSGVMDKNLNWIWGDGHLVIDGDVFDRGDMVTECLWLIYRLEIQAPAYGGRVHYILGNHDIMVMQADNRYIHDKYLKGIVRKSRIDHKDLYGPDMELGRWLRSKNTVIRVNNILFVHGGLAPYHYEKGYDLEKLNETVRNKLELRSSQIAFDSTAKFLFSSRGPFWYRGYFEAMKNRYSYLTTAGVDSVLAYYEASAIVVGHTGVDRISSMYGNRIYAIDIPFEDINSLEALLWENDKFYRITGEGKRVSIEPFISE